MAIARESERDERTEFSVYVPQLRLKVLALDHEEALEATLQTVASHVGIEGCDLVATELKTAKADPEDVWDEEEEVDAMDVLPVLFTPGGVAEIMTADLGRRVDAGLVRNAIKRGALPAIYLLGPGGAITGYGVHREDIRHWTPQHRPRRGDGS